MKKALSASPSVTTDFFGKPLVQSTIPENDGITTEYNLPHVGDRVTCKTHGPGTALSVGDPMWGPKWKNIEVRFDDGLKWFVSLNDLEVA